jgi:hypothetical protein
MRKVRRASGSSVVVAVLMPVTMIVVPVTRSVVVFIAVIVVRIARLVLLRSNEVHGSIAGVVLTAVLAPILCMIRRHV